MVNVYQRASVSTHKRVGIEHLFESVQADQYGVGVVEGDDGQRFEGISRRFEGRGSGRKRSLGKS